LMLYMVFGLINCSTLNPYNVLNIDKTASKSEIRKAYKDSVRKWHPDKNSSPEAEQKFIDIQKAYELLSNEEKRYEYDQGFSSQQNNHHHHHHHYSNFVYPDFFDFYDSTTISEQSFWNEVIQFSNSKPFVLFVYSRFDYSNPAERLWNEVTSTLRRTESKNIGYGHIDVMMKRNLLHQLGIQSLPAVLFFFHGKHKICTKSFQSATILKCLTTQINLWASPYVETLSINSVDKFLQLIEYDDKPRVLFTSDEEYIPIKFFLLAIQNHKHQTFGYIKFSKSVKENLNLKKRTLAVYEDAQRNGYQIDMDDFESDEIKRWLDQYLFPSLPRVHCQQRFDELCSEDQPSQICVMLLLSDHLQRNNKFWKDLSTQNYRLKTVKKLSYMAVNMKTQTAFVNSIFTQTSTNSSNAYLVLLSRRANKKAYKTIYSLKEEDNVFEILRNGLIFIYSGEFDQKVEIGDFYDELQENIFVQYFKKLLFSVTQFTEKQTGLIFFLLILSFVYFLNFYFSGPKKTSSKKETKSSICRIRNFHPDDFMMSKEAEQSTLCVIFFRGNSEMNILFKQFVSVMKIYSRLSTVKAFFVNIHLHQRWCNHIITEASPTEQNLTPLNGDVIVLNPKKMRFSIMNHGLRATADGDSQHEDDYKKHLSTYLDQVLDGRISQKIYVTQNS